MSIDGVITHQVDGSIGDEHWERLSREQEQLTAFFTQADALAADADRIRTAHFRLETLSAAVPHLQTFVEARQSVETTVRVAKAQAEYDDLARTVTQLATDRDGVATALAETRIAVDQRLADEVHDLDAKRRIAGEVAEATRTRQRDAERTAQHLRSVSIARDTAARDAAQIREALTAHGVTPDAAALESELADKRVQADTADRERATAEARQTEQAGELDRLRRSHHAANGKVESSAVSLASTNQNAAVASDRLVTATSGVPSAVLDKTDAFSSPEFWLLSGRSGGARSPPVFVPGRFRDQLSSEAGSSL